MHVLNDAYCLGKMVSKFYCFATLVVASQALTGYVIPRYVRCNYELSLAAHSPRAERKAMERAKKKKQVEMQGSKLTVESARRKIDALGEVQTRHNSGLPAAEEVERDIRLAEKSGLVLLSAHHNEGIAITRRTFMSIFDTIADGNDKRLLGRFVVAALKTKNFDVAEKAMMKRGVGDGEATAKESSSIIRALIRAGNTDVAEEVLCAELSPPNPPFSQNDDIEVIRERCVCLSSFVLNSLSRNERSEGVHYLGKLGEMGPSAREISLDSCCIPWLKIIQVAGRFESTARKEKEDEGGGGGGGGAQNTVFVSLDALSSFPKIKSKTESNKVYEQVANSLVRRVVFVTGAVSMDGLPAADRGEVCFIGRSNVGKSSLVNMVCNRKALAYTSKTPGKTQQFNYFAVNDKFDREKEIRFGDKFVDQKMDCDSFYLVDLPGFGYAKVPESQRINWENFMGDYFLARRNLRCVFHLVDSRHGLVDEDERIMGVCSQLLDKKRTAYVVVLTKADKNDGKVKGGVLESVRLAMRENFVGDRPIILTSAESKLGRDDIWRYLKVAMQGI